MNTQKLDQRLLEEIRVRRLSGIGAKDDLETFDVIIELAEELETPWTGSRENRIEQMKRIAEDAQSGLVAELRAMGVSQMESLALSNSASTALTLAQIERVAARSDVRRIRLRRIENVTTPTK